MAKLAIWVILVNMAILVIQVDLVIWVNVVILTNKVILVTRLTLVIMVFLVFISGGQKYTTSFFIWIVGFMWDIMIFEILCGINVGSYVKSLCVGR